MTEEKTQQFCESKPGGEHPAGHAEYVVPFGKEHLVLSTGKIARQANGSVVATVGGTVVLASVVMAPPRSETIDFFPLTVDYREKMYAAGRVPGGYFKREGRPGEAEILSARLIDRPLRPLFPDGFIQEVQVYINVLSFDGENSANVAALCAASTALIISDISFDKPVGAVRVGFDGVNYTLNPTLEQQKTSLLDLVVAGTKSAITMVESGAKMLTEEQMLGALRFGHAAIVKICEAQEELRARIGKPKAIFTKPDYNATIAEKIRLLSHPKFVKIAELYEKKERNDALDTARDEIIDALSDEYPDIKEVMKPVFEDEYSQSMRRRVLETGVRVDGRALDEIRHIWSEVDILPRTHGSALFTRGQTQSLGALTLGTAEDVQEIDDLEEVGERTFYMHYNFPSFSVGEVRPVRGPGRREIGHGALSERALIPVIPDHDKFPYTIRLVSEILESNGSSSMASVCGGCLAMMDGGVPITAPVAGIAMGLIMEGDRYAVLSDIMGLEDHLGDMDFKVAGTQDGITALQMDIKIEGITFEIMEKALAQAKEGRRHILGKMAETLAAPRADLKPHAPRIVMITINPDKIRDIIGTGGKVIKEITAKTGTKIDIQDNGQVFIASADGEAMERAVKWIRDLTVEAEIGQIYTGKVTRIEDFGAFVEILPGKDGLCHVSELEPRRVERVEDICRLGDELIVKVIGIDEKGKIRLSRKQALYPTAKPEEGEERGGGRGDRGGRGGRGGDRGGRGGDRGGNRGGGNRGDRSAGGGSGERRGSFRQGGGEHRYRAGEDTERAPAPAEERREIPQTPAEHLTDNAPGAPPQHRPWTNEIEDELKP
ncbi:MAG: polyribonucleotide nucleotidyltransferase [bacterium]